MTTNNAISDKPYSGWKARAYGYIGATLAAVAIEAYTPVIQYLQTADDSGDAATYAPAVPGSNQKNHSSLGAAYTATNESNTFDFIDALSAKEYAMMHKGPGAKQKWLTDIEKLSWTKPLDLEYLVSENAQRVLKKVNPVGAQYFDLIVQAVQKYSDIHTLDPLLLWSVAYRESRFDKDAESKKGARGLFQVTRILAKQYGVDYGMLFDPATNIDVAVRNLAELAQDYGGYMPLVFAIHNTGLAKFAKKGLSFETKIFITETLTFNEYVMQYLMHPERMEKKFTPVPSQA